MKRQGQVIYIYDYKIMQFTARQSYKNVIK